MLSPEQKSDLGPEKREEILSRCPLLRAFIDRTKPIKLWAGEVGNSFVRVDKELKRTQEEKLGYSWLGAMIVIAPKMIRFHLYSEYYSDWSSERDSLGATMLTVTSLFLIGYEVGSKNEAFFFIPDILKRLDDVHFFKSELFDSDKGWNTFFDHIAKIIERGVETKKKLLGAEIIKEAGKKELEIEEEPEDDNFDVFAKFINSLDFGDED